MARRPVVFIHGYSDKGASFRVWADKLTDLGYDPQNLYVCSYETLTNEVTIPDIAEGFDRALREQVGLNEDEPFDAIVHSTGMLVIRSWLVVFANRRDRLKHLIALAPATFGSPLAHKGRSWLGGLFKGRKELGPDFLEAGDRVLDGLELGSRFTWDLSEKDLFGSDTCYGPGGHTPYVFVFCGTEGYGDLRSLIRPPGSDGTVRWAGCAMNVRKINIDLTRTAGEQRATFSKWTNEDVPLVPIRGLNHGSILSKPTDDLVELVHAALAVEDEPAWQSWLKDARHRTRDAYEELPKWQQFIMRAVDERGDPIADYYIQLKGSRNPGQLEELENFDGDVHPYSGDPSLRNFHVNLDEVDPASLKSLSLHVMASAGSTMVSYHGFTGDGAGDSPIYDHKGAWHAVLDLSDLLGEREVRFFYPFTTTLVELRLNREPLPLQGRNKVCWFE